MGVPFERNHRHHLVCLLAVLRVRYSSRASSHRSAGTGIHRERHWRYVQSQRQGMPTNYILTSKMSMSGECSNLIFSPGQNAVARDIHIETGLGDNHRPMGRYLGPFHVTHPSAHLLQDYPRVECQKDRTTVRHSACGAHVIRLRLLVAGRLAAAHRAHVPYECTQIGRHIFAAGERCVRDWAGICRLQCDNGDCTCHAGHGRTGCRFHWAIGEYHRY